MTFLLWAVILFAAGSLCSCNPGDQKEENTTAASTDAAPLYSCAPPSRFASKKIAPEDMIWIEGAEFMMGTDEKDAYEPERPAHPVKVDGFFMDITKVTNEQFKKFVEATGYVTFAEKKPEWED